jgi:RNA polymerase sigma-70 factor (ECF subfamily)
MREEAEPARDAGRPEAGPDRLSAVIEGLVDRWVGIIRRAAAKYRLAGPEVEELTQDIRLRLWRIIEREGTAAVVSPGYVYRAAISAAIDLVRRRRTERRELCVSLEIVEGELADAQSAGAHQERDFLEARDRALQAIPASRRPAVRLHLSGRHLAEIATTMGWSQAKARNLLYRGLADLRESLGKAYGLGA